MSYSGFQSPFQSLDNCATYHARTVMEDVHAFQQVPKGVTSTFLPQQAKFDSDLHNLPDSDGGRTNLTADDLAIASSVRRRAYYD